ncbi:MULTISPECIES: ATP-binding protein [unclassified Streptomyces]|uniref:ATP-binding protein n=1 Tax=unclassified Streptomyces TaxID=2593676 RepID=UPI00225A7F19|nr:MULTISPECIES: ATP-binding protein [unclassified Streptomyces]MCX4987808.1 ATP-binding protein [Streptomyces sp. NBC_00568]MCX5007059.1 ATP-binding protein [Streptomyces sp. NBC_00638]
MTERIPEAASWCLAAGLLAVTVLLLRQRGITTRQRRRTAALADDLRARDEELRRMVAVRLPALEAAPHQHAPTGAPAGGLLDARLADTDFAKHLDSVLERFSEAVDHAQARADQSAKAALKASMRSIQALANEQQVSIAEMQDRHDHPDVLRDLLEIDHTNAQFGRRAQAIAVLCGSWPGRQRSTSALIEVVRGATSRVRDYRRVRVNGQVDIAVESRAVEPVVLAVAELLDNAARHSQPNTTVEVTVQSVHNGACVVIDDAGVGMDGRATEQAAALLTGRDAVDVTRLDDPPQFGFAVIGVLAARYGFSVSVDTRSPYGGVRAVVFLPSALLTHVAAAPEAPRAGPSQAEPATAAGRSAGPGAPARPTPRVAEPVETTTAGGLPKRRRRGPQQAAPAEQPAAVPAEDVSARSAEENARRMGAFARGTRFGRAARDTTGTPDAPGMPGIPGEPEALAPTDAPATPVDAPGVSTDAPAKPTDVPVTSYDTPHENEGNTQG